MKITYKCDYALKVVLDLSLHYNRELVRSRALARRIDVPVKFLEQVLMELKKGGIIESKRGKVGGYLLSKSPSEITVGQIVRIIEGSIEPISCVNENYSNCIEIERCVFKRLWQRVFQAQSAIVDNTTFKQLVLQESKEWQGLTYSI